MSDKNLTSLPAASTVTGDELVYVVQGGNSRKIPLKNTGSVVLADVDLSVTDIQLSGTPVVITGIDQFAVLEFYFEVVRASGADAVLQLSNDGGSTFLTTSGDYRRWFWSSSGYTDRNVAQEKFVLSNSDTSVMSIGRMVNMGRANTETAWSAAIGGGGATNANTMGRRAVAEVNNACRVFTTTANTSGRLTVTGIF